MDPKRLVSHPGVQGQLDDVRNYLHGDRDTEVGSEGHIWPAGVEFKPRSPDYPFPRQKDILCAVGTTDCPFKSDGCDAIIENARGLHGQLVTVSLLVCVPRTLSHWKWEESIWSMSRCSSDRFSPWSVPSCQRRSDSGLAPQFFHTSLFRRKRV